MNIERKYKCLAGAVFFLVSAPMFSGCATIVKGSSQTLTVDTRPPGATCKLLRDGETLAVVNPTPGAISIEKDKDVIHVTCSKEGYKICEGDVGSEFQAMTFGNILFGGLIGVVVDAGSGAMNAYPPIVTLTLIPESFESEKVRDAFFDHMREQFISESEISLQKIEKSCPEDSCEKQVQDAKKAREKKLDEIESLRRDAIVR
jgi:hypothetical protein